MIIKTTQKDLFNIYLFWLQPILKLTETERKILSALLSLHYAHRHRYQNPEVLNDLLFMESTNKELSKKLKIPLSKYNKVLQLMKDKGLLHSDGPKLSINPVLTNYPKDNKFKIQVEFQIE